MAQGFVRTCACLSVPLQYIKRKRTAEAMRHAYEERLQSADGGAAAAGDGQAAAVPLAGVLLRRQAGDCCGQDITAAALGVG